MQRETDVAMSVLPHALRWIPWVMSMTVAMFLFDTLGDQQGAVAALWAPLCMLSTPILAKLWQRLQHRRRHAPGAGAGRAWCRVSCFRSSRHAHTSRDAVLGDLADDSSGQVELGMVVSPMNSASTAVGTREEARAEWAPARPSILDLNSSF